VQVLMTSSNPAPLREVVRLMAVLVARPRMLTPQPQLAPDMLTDVLHDNVLLNQGLL